MERVRQFFSAILAGMLIGMGGTVFLSQSNPVVGSFLFAIGLFTIVVFQLHLFTGRLATRPSTSLCISLSWWSLGWGTLLAHGLQQQWYETAVFMREWLNGLRAWLK